MIDFGNMDRKKRETRLRLLSMKKFNSFEKKRSKQKEEEEEAKSTINRFVICLLEQHIFATYIFHHVTCVWSIYTRSKITQRLYTKKTIRMALIVCTVNWKWNRKKNAARTHCIDFCLIHVSHALFMMINIYHLNIQMNSCFWCSDNDLTMFQHQLFSTGNFHVSFNGSMECEQYWK